MAPRSTITGCWVFYFTPNRSVSRVVTIASPHRGSHFSNAATRYLFGRLVSLPRALTEGFSQLNRDNPGLFRDGALDRARTSVDSLSPDSPLLPVLLAAPRPPGMKLHTIAGQESPEADGDGIVSLASARLEDADSDLIVPATIHSHPLAILEVRRILLEHIARPPRRFPDLCRDKRVQRTSGTAP